MGKCNTRERVRESSLATNLVFSRVCEEFDNQDIETSLKSENLIVKIFAVLDRRVGKRRLKIMKETIMDEPDTFQEFYAIRVKAEGLL